MESNAFILATEGSKSQAPPESTAVESLPACPDGLEEQWVHAASLRQPGPTGIVPSGLGHQAFDLIFPDFQHEWFRTHGDVKAVENGAAPKRRVAYLGHGAD